MSATCKLSATIRHCGLLVQLLMPLPSYPSLHAHVRVVDGGARSAHVAMVWQDCVKHALMSDMYEPSPSSTFRLTCAAVDAIALIPSVAGTCPGGRRRCQVRACGLGMAWLCQARVDVCELIVDALRLQPHQTCAAADAIATISSIAGADSVERRKGSVCARGQSMTWLIQCIDLLGAVQ